MNVLHILLPLIKKLFPAEPAPVPIRVWPDEAVRKERLQ